MNIASMSDKNCEYCICVGRKRQTKTSKNDISGVPLLQVALNILLPNVSFGNQDLCIKLSLELEETSGLEKSLTLILYK